MYTSVYNPKAARFKKAAWTYGILTAFCGIFSLVYLQFSHGESSPFLIWLFAPSLLLGMIPALILSRASGIRLPGIPVRRIWNSGIATLSAGMLVRSVINISGRYTDYDLIYWIAAGLLFSIAIIRYYLPPAAAVQKT